MQIAPMSSETPTSPKPPGVLWNRIVIDRIEDLSESVLGAEFETVQLSRTPVTGAIAHTVSDEILLSTGVYYGRVAASGPLSTTNISFGVGLELRPGSRQWLHDVETGNVGVFAPNEAHDAIYAPHAHYLVVTLPEERLHAEAERAGIVVDPAMTRHSGLHARRMNPRTLAALRKGAMAALQGSDDPKLGAAPERRALGAFLAHVGRTPSPAFGMPPPNAHERIVARARDYIRAHLEDPINIDALADHARASRRTLNRAFAEVLEESPRSYVLRLRLHRIRSDLATEAETACTVAIVSNRWGIGELGRLAGRYKAQFGELPSQTIAQARERLAISA